MMKAVQMELEIKKGTHRTGTEKDFFGNIAALFGITQGKYLLKPFN